MQELDSNRFYPYSRLDECKKRGECTPSAGVIIAMKEPISLEDSDEMNFTDSDSSASLEAKSSSESKMMDNSEEGKGQEGRKTSLEANVYTYKLRLWCAFTTSSMAVGYISSEDSAPRVRPMFNLKVTTKLIHISRQVYCESLRNRN